MVRPRGPGEYTHGKITGTPAGKGLWAGVSRTADPNTPHLHRPRPQISDGAFFKRGAIHNAAETRPPGVLEGTERAPGSTRPAEGRPRGRTGAGPAKSARAPGWSRRRLPGGTQGLRGAGRGRCGVPLPRSYGAHPGTLHPRPIPTPARDANTCPGPEGAPTAPRRCARHGRARPAQGAPGRAGERPAGDGACAVARARPSAGNEHAQCEGTIGYVGAWGMLGESPGPAHAQKRSEPATRWWREKRGEKPPQSYVRKGRVWRGGCGLPRGPAVLLGRAA